MTKTEEGQLMLSHDQSSKNDRLLSLVKGLIVQRTLVKTNRGLFGDFMLYVSTLSRLGAAEEKVHEVLATCRDLSLGGLFSQETNEDLSLGAFLSYISLEPGSTFRFVLKSVEEHEFPSSLATDVLVNHYVLCYEVRQLNGVVDFPSHHRQLVQSLLSLGASLDTKRLTMIMSPQDEDPSLRLLSMSVFGSFLWTAIQDRYNMALWRWCLELYMKKGVDLTQRLSFVLDFRPAVLSSEWVYLQDTTYITPDSSCARACVVEVNLAFLVRILQSRYSLTTSPLSTPPTAKVSHLLYWDVVDELRYVQVQVHLFRIMNERVSHDILAGVDSLLRKGHDVQRTIKQENEAYSIVEGHAKDAMLDSKEYARCKTQDVVDYLLDNECQFG